MKFFNKKSQEPEEPAAQLGEDGSNIHVWITSCQKPASPPRREPQGRVQMNARVDADRMRALKRYQHQHGATFQAVVDQMVDEYLERRGLL